MTTVGEYRGNRLIVATDTSPGAVVSVGVWCAAGSRHDYPTLGGLAHFVEHCLFKGTSQRSAARIFQDIEEVGGDINAMTGQEATGFYANVPANRWRLALDVLSDLVCCPTFPEDEVERERGVVAQEIREANDNPEECIQERFVECLWRYSAFGQPIAGYLHSLERITREHLVDFHRNWYHPEHMVLAVAGPVEHAEVLEALEHVPLGVLGSGTTVYPPFHPSGPVTGTYHEPRDWGQYHTCLGVPTFGQVDDDYAALLVLNMMLGGMSSARLQQQVREQRGLAYTITSYVEAYRTMGSLVMYAATSPEHAPLAQELMRVEASSFAAGCFSREELERAKACLVGHLRMSMETSHARMQRLARNILYYYVDKPIEQVVRDVEFVSHSSVCVVAQKLFTGQWARVTMGPSAR